MDEGKLIREQERGRLAQQVLEHAIFREAVDKVQSRIFDDFSKVEPADTERMRILRLKLNCLAEITRELGEVVNTGKLAAQQLAEERGFADRLRAMGRGWRA